MIPRSEVYEAIDGERDYQDAKWGLPNVRTVGEFALYISVWADKLRTLSATELVSVEHLDLVRKIGALSVACMEQHGAPYRSPVSIQFAHAARETLDAE